MPIGGGGHTANSPGHGGAGWQGEGMPGGVKGVKGGKRAGVG